MEKTLLEIVEELNRRPVSDRVEIPKARDVEKASLVPENENDNHRRDFNRLLRAAVKQPKSSG
jgi:hypothetical protein